jgi:dihydroorotate dehydrogenase (fumarate)
MIQLETNYLGLKLRNPIVVSPSPLCENLDNLLWMEQAGAAAIVLHSLFEEQITLERNKLDRFLRLGTDSYSESLSFFPDMEDYNLGPDGYLEHIQQAKSALKIPLIGSLNGVTIGGWVEYAKKIEEAGADALELNIYDIPVDPETSAVDLEKRYCDLVFKIQSNLKIPLAIKLHPFFTTLPNFARCLNQAGARGLVLFNRFYQPDFDLERLEVVPRLTLSSPQELLLRLHWVAILYGNVGADLAITGGIHSATDVLKAMMAGARVAMMTSAILKNGIRFITKVLEDLRAWMVENEYESIRLMQGSMSRVSSGEPAAFERANYMKVLGSYQLAKE